MDVDMVSSDGLVSAFQEYDIKLGSDLLQQCKKKNFAPILPIWFYCLHINSW